jgi:hypothetical protein
MDCVCRRIDDYEFRNVVGRLTSFLWCFVCCILGAFELQHPMRPSCFTAFWFGCAPCHLLHWICILLCCISIVYINVDCYLSRLAVSSRFLSNDAWRYSPVCFLFEWDLLCFTKFPFHLHIQVISSPPRANLSKSYQASPSRSYSTSPARKCPASGRPACRQLTQFARLEV